MVVQRAFRCPALLSAEVGAEHHPSILYSPGARMGKRLLSRQVKHTEACMCGSECISALFADLRELRDRVSCIVLVLVHGHGWGSGQSTVEIEVLGGERGGGRRGGMGSA